MGRLYGYARVSSETQDLSRQIHALKEAGVEEKYIVQEKASGKNTKGRPKYLHLRNTLLREGDTIAVVELDRISRNYKEMQLEYEFFRNEGIFLEVIEFPLLSTTGKSDLETTLIANIVFQLMSYLAEKERKQIKSRQRMGIEEAKRQGKHLGRPKVERPRNFIRYYDMWMANEITAEEAMILLDLKRTTFYNFVREARKQDVR